MIGLENLARQLCGVRHLAGVAKRRIALLLLAKAQMVAQAA